MSSANARASHATGRASSTNWWVLVGIAPIVAVIIFMIWEMMTYEEPPLDETEHDPSRASWTSSAIQDDMHGDE